MGSRGAGDLDAVGGWQVAKEADVLACEQLEGADTVVLLEQARIATEPRGEARLGLVEVRGGDARVLVVVAEGGEQQRQALVGSQWLPKATFFSQHVGHLGKRMAEN